MLPALTVYAECEQYRSLPTEGGVLDQEYELMQDLRLIANTVAAERLNQARRGQARTRVSQRHR